jgi:AcrR family transcriptional regulator
MRTPDTAHGNRVEPRSERTRRAVLAAARELVVTSSYKSATVEAIAARAKVGKPTVYRRWENRAAVVVDALLADARSLVPVPDSGCVRTDLQQYLRLIARAVTLEPPGMALAGVIGEAQLTRSWLSASPPGCSAS